MSEGEITAVAILLAGLFAAEAEGHARGSTRSRRWRALADAPPLRHHAS